MKFIVTITLIIIFGSLLTFTNMPWWSIAIVSSAVAFQTRMTATASFFAGFLAVLLLWGTHAYFINSGNDGVLLAKISELLKMGTITIWAIMLLIGGLLGGFSATTGVFLRAVALGDTGNSNSRRRRR
jgi:hypothetical protein